MKIGIDDKTAELIKSLASKLGTTADHLWGVLVHQAPITATVDVLTSIAFIVVTVIWMRTVAKKTKTPPETVDDRYPRAEWDDDVAVFFSWLSVAILTVLCAVFVSVALQEAATALFNPEYWAMSQLGIVK